MNRRMQKSILVFAGIAVILAAIIIGFISFYSGNHATHINGVTIEQTDNTLSILKGKDRLVYHIDSGQFDYTHGKTIGLQGLYSSFFTKEGVEHKSTETVNGLKRLFGKAYIKPVEDKFGKGVRVTIGTPLGENGTLWQHFSSYQEDVNFFVQTEWESQNETGTNHMVAIAADRDSIQIGRSEDGRVLLVPFDNDQWVRYESKPFGSYGKGYEVTAMYNQATLNGFIIGSVTHDIWKTGIDFGASSEGFGGFSVYGGAASPGTRDTLPHGMVTGKRIFSPTISLGAYDNYKDGLEQFGFANAKVQPALAWKGSVPFGWNSWGAYKEQVTYERMIYASQYIKDNLQDKGFQSGEIYVNMDSYWDNLTSSEIEKFVQTVKSNKQQPGIYWAPFVYWGNDLTSIVEGTNGKYTYADIVLKDQQGLPVAKLDGAFALDPTHPGTKARIDWQFTRFKAWGFKYIKLDFLTHVSLEGVHHDPAVQTGIQAYNQGMKYVSDQIKDSMFISQAISPIFPGGYAHSRRIACDAFASIQDTEYTLNSLSYGWWLNNTVYRFNDPDHIKLAGTTDNEARSRVNSGVIAGTVFLDGDNFHNEQAQELAVKLLTQPEVNRIARLGLSFRPLDDVDGGKAAEWFVLHQGEEVYVAVFNYNPLEPSNKIMEAVRLGLKANTSYILQDVWERSSLEFKDKIDVKLKPTESKLFRIVMPTK